MPQKTVFKRVCLCNEGFYKLYGEKGGATRPPGLGSHRAIIDPLAKIGYNEFELVAPTLREDPLQLTEQVCTSFRQAAEEVGGRNAALHWALAGTDGYLTDSDPEVQERTVQIIVHLAKVIYWLGGDIITARRSSGTSCHI